MAASQIQPGLLRKMTVRKILESLQEQGPLSRADLTRETGISAPTVSKAVADLLDSGLLEEGAAPDYALGRPGRKLQLARNSAQVIGIVLDSGKCCVLPASLDGQIDKSLEINFPTPDSYAALREQLIASVQSLVEQSTCVTLGVGISTPGLVDEEKQRCLFSPNLKITNNHSPATDIRHATGLETTCVQETRGLCLAERFYGAASGLDDFAMLDITTGLGLGVFIGGELLRGHNGLAGEIGHITVAATGRLCGCGNRGCLETLATDTALATLISERIGRRMLIGDIVAEHRAGTLPWDEELKQVCEYLTIALAATINLFNPSTLFIHGRLLSVDDAVMERVIEGTRRRTLEPSFEKCTIQAAATDKQQGAVAAIVHHLTQATGPRVASR